MKPIRIVDIVKAVKAIDYTSSNRFDTITNVQFDSRLCDENSLFIPLTNGQTDGHDYVHKAIENGAKVTLWSHTQESAPENISVIFVDDTLLAMQDLAHYYLSVIQPCVVGVTGSNGKTTTKDMIAALLSTTYNVHKTNGNYNNEIGVPKTVLDMPEHTQIIVVEMGMDGFNQITHLSQLVQPEIAVITLIGESHLEFLKTREGVAQAKLEIVDGLRENGVLIVPENEPLLNKKYTQPLTVQTFGTSEYATATIENIVVNEATTQFQLKQFDQTPFTLNVIGQYNAYNASAALLVGRYFNVPVTAMQTALQHIPLTKNRTEWLVNTQNVHILNDAYNASPTAMKAILNDFQTIKVPRKRYVVLGDMRELGDLSDELHAQLSECIDTQQFDGIYLYGTHMKALATAINSDKVHYFQLDEKKALIQTLQHTLQAEDYVLIKSSFGTNLLEVVAILSEKLNV